MDENDSTEEPKRFWRWSEPKCKVRIITREEWHAQPPRRVARYDSPTTIVVSCYTNTQTCFTIRSCRLQVKKLQEEHMLAGHDDIRYNYLVGGDGNVYEGRGWNAEPEIVVDGEIKYLEDSTLYIALSGQYDCPRTPKFLWETRHALVKYGVAARIIKKDYHLLNIK